LWFKSKLLFKDKKTDASSLGISLEATIVITAGQTFLAIFLTGDWFILSILTY
jgi:hypothetical protein